ncbi:Na+/H+ antiporter subunit E [Dactylosporangium fulvum]|uniref:Na+/H+ antiporter subunit E n=1 Tax=Dactylosporangium fulvum TaxID=53359 RepID=A0ABY5VPQ8_9ACTN|nr:Na+/H+ antiporter subunit E [Dactylosporangium fulvum]UWP79260.1 Na+/H+ antiporter subunit E [Dactylosporangium fulvum]
MTGVSKPSAGPTAATNPPLTRRARLRNHLIAATVLVAIWMLLWGSFTWADLIGGILIVVVLLAVFPLPPVTFAGKIRPVPLARFSLRFLRDLVVASAQIAWLAMRFGHTPRSAIIAVPLRVNTDLNLTLTAEALSLVPGSLIVEADRTSGTLYVHVIGVRSLDEVERFRRNVLDLEARIVAAVGSAEERRRVNSPAAAGPPVPADQEGPST